MRGFVLTVLSGLVAVTGLLYGDEGKGKVVDALVRRTGARIVVRPGGGPQAAHHVVTDDGRVHCFSQLPAGLLVPGVRGFLGREMLVDPLALAREAEAIAASGVPGALGRLTADPASRLVTPLHRIVGQMRELARGDLRHGSCGRGVGEAVRDAAARGPEALTLADLVDPPLLLRKLRLLRAVALDHAEQLTGVDGSPAGALVERLGRLRRLDLPALAAAFRAAAAGLDLSGEEALERALGDEETVVLEGAHGVLLDPVHGFVPHVTATDTTFGPALRLAARVAPGRGVVRLGVLRAYATRHGAGPFPTEDPGLTADLPEPHNVPNEWQGPMRCGWADLVALRYARDVCGGLDALAVTHLDRLAGRASIPVAAAYRGEGPVPAPDVGAHESAGGGWRAARLAAVERPVPARQRSLARLLRAARAEVVGRPGWPSPGSAGADLPEAAVSMLELLSSSAVLAAPVAVVSLGAASGQTLFPG